MPTSAADLERAERTLKRTIIKRDENVNFMRILHDLALKVERDEDVLPLFRARKREIKTILSTFQLEQDAIIDQLIILNREDEYKSVHASLSASVFEQYYFIMAVSDTAQIDELPTSYSQKSDSMHIQLPKIQIPHFDGDILRWSAFRDTFNSLVHNNFNLSNIERFHYLLSAVSGSASAVIRAVPLSDANYKVAWDALNDRFNNQRLIMNAHLDKLFSVSPLRSSSLNELKGFLDIFQENIAALNSFEIPDKVGFLLFYVASRVLDSTTKCLFESQHTDKDVPVIDDLLKFIQTHCQVLQNSSSSSTSLSTVKDKSVYSKEKSKPLFKTSLVIASAENTTLCPCCRGTHHIYRCDKFIQLSAAKRLKLIQTRRMCTNCLNGSHTVSKCSSKYTCRHCSAKHHSLLHLDHTDRKNVLTSGSVSPDLKDPSPSASTLSLDKPSQVFVGTASSTNLNILGTAVVRMCNKFGHWIPVRALIDSGSQISAITHACASKLGLSTRRNNVAILGLSQSPIAQTKGVATCKFIPHSSLTPEFICEPIILSKITGLMPCTSLDPVIRSTYMDLQFADPSFDQPGRIDFLIGADIYNRIFANGYQVRHSVSLPSAFETNLGWILVGTSTQSTSISPRVCLTLSSEPSLVQLLHRFWECEEPIIQSNSFTEEEKCEDIFSRTTSRDHNGRYSLSFPFKVDPSTLGDSRNMAVSRFYNLERKLQQDPDVYHEYRLFMEEYIKLNHMNLATVPGKYLIPHHAVVKRSENKIKLRVVFDASARTSSGKSLNDLLFTGTKLQCDIFDLLLRCRLHKFMFTADICKMYRQIGIHSSDRLYQHILWRNDPSESLQEFELNTVTYGISSSPFQAIRVLHKLEEDEGVNYPETKGVLSTQTYVDDILTGANTVQEVLERQEQIIQLLKCGGFELKKWASNCIDILNNVPAEDQTNGLSLVPKDDSSVKILGLHWDPSSDTFGYQSGILTSAPTKRCILSTIAKMYDPLGALAPITFWAKWFIQLLWKEGYDWDTPISNELAATWKSFSEELPFVSSTNITRFIPLYQCLDAQIIGFSDASSKGFSAVVYIRIVHASGQVTIHFITAKSRVAPLKTGRMDPSLSIPRLELCGAVLLAQTMHRVQQGLSSTLKISTLHAWTDSTVVLAWLTNSQIQFKVFVTHRLQKISELIPSCQWHHVPSGLNPADCVSRGMLPKEILHHNLYWDGPPFLRESIPSWKTSHFENISIDKLPEIQSIAKTVHLATTIDAENDCEWFESFSSLTRLERVIAYMNRFIARTKKVTTYSDFLRREELDTALMIVVQSTQKRYFKKLFVVLSSPNSTVSPRSLASLSPFIDRNGVIRVGGRLRCADVSEEFRCPILLPKVCILNTLLIRRFHEQNLHAGPLLVASLLSTRFWILSGRSVIRHVIFKCVICARHRATSPQPIMGDLPPSRVRPSRPFSNVGIDYAGPLSIKEGKRKNSRSVKCYLAIFICMAVKAVHIEVVSDLTSVSFLAALQRFISRRGIPSSIRSDCGTNFQGANKELRNIFSDPVAQNLFSNTVPCRWNFNPPASPHFGGLWEAAVKSTKFHLKRVVGTQIMTFEEMCTLVHRIEAVLNSRPLIPQSSDPNDLEVLTPGHFLIGCPLVALPEPDLTATPPNRLTRWQLVNQLHQSFWKRWSVEYLTTLQGKSKWQRKQNNLAPGDLVVVHTPNLPPTFWNLGRIESIHPGEDGVVRVVTVRTKDGVYKRPVVKLSVLPITEGNIS